MIGVPWRTGVCIVLFYWVMPLLSSMHMCSVSDQYPFSCSACLSFSVHNSTYSAASQECGQQGGRLVTLQDDTEWNMLLLYLESLNLTNRGLWVGYRLGEGGEVIGEGLEGGLEVVQQLLSVTVGGEGECVMVRERELVNSVCSEERNYVCLFTYSAPRLTHAHPPLGTIYQVPTHTLSLEASLSGLGITDLQWRHNQIPLTPSTTTDLRTSHDYTWAELHISDYTQEVHGGSYELLVTSPAGCTLAATWTVEQAALGHFTRTPQNLIIPEGSIAFFECSVGDAMPAPTFTWYRRDDPIIPNGMSIYVSNVTHTLLMRDVGEEDRGSYHCHVENIAGSMDSPAATLTLTTQQHFTGSEAQFLLHPQNSTVLEGESYSMECVALHLCPSYLYLINYTSLLYPSQQGLPVLMLPRVSLSEHNGIQSACYSGPSHYMFDSHLVLIPSWPAVLTVHTHPHIDSLMTSVGNGSGPSTIPPASELEIKCAYGGAPKPVNRWYWNGSVIGGDDELVVEAVDNSSGGSYVATWHVSVPQSGVYQCHVTNQYGVAISTTVLCAQAIVGPTPFSVQSDTISSLHVMWDVPESPSFHPFVLRYVVITTHTLTNHTISSGTLLPHQSPWVVDGLNPSSEYEVKVMSWSPLGRGEEALGQTAFTFGLAPQVSPLEFLNITVSRTHQNSGLVVQWNVTHPPLPGTVITHYRVQYRTIDGVDGGGGVNEEGYIVQVDASQGWILVNELEDAQGYEIRLSAGVQVQRSPLAYDHTPWTVWMPVQGVTTLIPTSHIPPSQGPAENPASTHGLLITVLAPVLSVLVLVILLVSLMVCVWRLWAKRRAATYHPSKHERHHKGRQIPMGRDVFNLPSVGSSAVEVIQDCAVVSNLPTVNSSRPSLQSEELTVDSPVHTQSSNVE